MPPQFEPVSMRVRVGLMGGFVGDFLARGDGLRCLAVGKPDGIAARTSPVLCSPARGAYVIHCRPPSRLCQAPLPPTMNRSFPR